MEVKPGYKQTEVGVIPEEWNTHRLGELLQGPRSIRYGIVQPGKFDATGCYMLRSQDYSKGWAGPDGMHKVSAQLENQYRNARILHNDLVITVVGAGIGQVVIVPQWLDGAILSRSTARVAIDEDKAARSFVRAFLEGPLGKRQILDCQKEGAQPVVSCIDLAKFFVAYPPLPEQRAIATALSDVDGLLGGLDLLIAKKRDLKQAAMQQLLTGQTRLPGFHGDWEMKTLGSVLSKGRLGGNYANQDAEAELPLMKMGNLARGYFDLSKVQFIQPGVTPEVTRRLFFGDVLFNTRNTLDLVGKVAIWRDELPVAYYNSNLMRLEFDPEQVCSNQYANYALNTDSAVSGLRGLATGTTSVAAIYTRDLMKLQVIVPPLPEQTAIAEVLTEMDAELAALEQRREKTHALKQAMMQELLTGRTRLVAREAAKNAKEKK